MSSPESPTARLRRALRDGCAVIRREDDHWLLIEGRDYKLPKEDAIGVVFLNSNRAFYNKAIMRPGFAKRRAKRDGARLVDTGDDRECWPSRYQNVSFTEADSYG